MLICKYAFPCVRYETPRDFLIEREPFSRTNLLLTDSNKLARSRLRARYGPALEAKYEALDTSRMAMMDKLALQSDATTADKVQGPQ
jgi:fatty acid CoA ligase FadD9